jgi:cytochrome b
MRAVLVFFAAVRIDASNPIGAIIIAIILTAVAIGLVYGLFSWLVEKIILPIMKIPEEKRDKHVLNKVVWIVTGLVAVAGLLMLILPACGVDTGPLNLANLIDF